MKKPLKIAEQHADTGPHHCPICSHKIDAASHVSERGEYATPTAGDLTVCIRCSNWLIFRDDLSMRPITPEERRELTPELRAKLVAVTMATNQIPWPEGK
jgi:hypothetical protein